MLIRDKVNELIKHGYDDDVIAMSLGLSDKEMQAIKKEIEAKTNTRTRFTRMESLRKRYYDLYNAEEPKKVETQAKKALTEEQIKDITEKLDRVETILTNIDQLSLQQQVRASYNIRDIFSEFDILSLPFDLTYRAYSILNNHISYKIKDKRSLAFIKKLMEKYKSKCFEAIRDEIDKADDMKTLESLSAKLKTLSDGSYLVYSNAQSVINKKMTDIRINNYSENAYISDEAVESIASSLLDPSTDIEDVKEKIRKYGMDYYERKKKMVEETVLNKNLASLKAPTIEGSIKQVSFKMTDFLRKEADILDLDFAFRRMTELNISKSVAAGVITANLISNHRFDDADDFVERVYTNNKDKIEINSKRSSKSQIKRAEIAFFIMKGIEAKEGDIADEDRYLDTIESGIAKANYDPSTIILGTSKDGKRKITWANLIEREKVKREFDFSD